MQPTVLGSEPEPEPVPRAKAPLPSSMETVVGQVPPPAPPPRRQATPPPDSPPSAAKSRWPLIGCLLAVATVFVAVGVVVFLVWREENKDNSDTKKAQVEGPLPPEGPVLRGGEPRLLATMTGHQSMQGLTTLLFLPDGKRAVSRNYISLHHWDLTDHEERPEASRFAHHDPGSVAVAQNGQRIAASAGNSIELFDGTTYQKENKAMGCSNTCTALALTPDGKVLATAVQEYPKCLVRFWDAQTHLPLDQKPLEYATAFTLLSYSLDGRFLVTSNSDPNNQQTVDVAHKRLRVWDARDSRLVRELKGHDNALSVAAFFADGRRIFSASPSDGTLRVWNNDENDAANVGREQEEKRIRAGTPSPPGGRGAREPKQMTGFAFWPWGRALTGYRHGGFALWNLDTGQKLWECSTPSDDADAYVIAAAISPDGHHALTALTDGKVYLYRLPPPAARGKP
jgi:WD40 repeat protein